MNHPCLIPGCTHLGEFVGFGKLGFEEVTYWTQSGRVYLCDEHKELWVDDKTAT